MNFSRSNECGTKKTQSCLKTLVIAIETFIVGIVICITILARMVLPVEMGSLFLTFLQVILGVNDVIMMMEETAMKKNKMESGTHGAVRVY